MLALTKIICKAIAWIAKAARAIVARFRRWNEIRNLERERLRQKGEYMRVLLDSDAVYRPEECDRQLIEKCKTLVSEYFPQGVEATLLPLSLEARAELVRKFTQAAAETMEVQIDDVVFSHQMNGQGFFNYNTRSVTLNLAYLYADEPAVLRDVINTVFHECKHARQYRAILEGADYGYSTDLLREWVRNINLYIRPEECDEAYLKQPIELDAFGFADSIIKC